MEHSSNTQTWKMSVLVFISLLFLPLISSQPGKSLIDYMQQRLTVLGSSVEKLLLLTKCPWEMKAVPAFLVNRTTEASKAVTIKHKGLEKQLMYLGVTWEGSYYKHTKVPWGCPDFQSHDIKAFSLPTGARHMLASSQQVSTVGRGRSKHVRLPQRTSYRHSSGSVSNSSIYLLYHPTGAQLPPHLWTRCSSACFTTRTFQLPSWKALSKFLKVSFFIQLEGVFLHSTDTSATQDHSGKLNHFT